MIATWFSQTQSFLTINFSIYQYNEECVFVRMNNVMRWCLINLGKTFNKQNYVVLADSFQRNFSAGIVYDNAVL